MKQTDILNLFGNDIKRLDDGAWVYEKGIVNIIIRQGFYKDNPVGEVCITFQIALPAGLSSLDSNPQLFYNNVALKSLPKDSTKEQVELAVAEMFLGFMSNFDEMRHWAEETYDELKDRC